MMLIDLVVLTKTAATGTAEARSAGLPPSMRHLFLSLSMAAPAGCLAVDMLTQSSACEPISSPKPAKGAILKQVQVVFRCKRCCSHRAVSTEQSY